MKLKMNVGVQHAFLVVVGFVIILFSLMSATIAGLNSLNSVNERLASMVAEQEAKQHLLRKSQALMRKQLDQAQRIVELKDRFAIEVAWEEFLFDIGQMQHIQDQLILFALKQENAAVSSAFQPKLDEIRCSLQEILQLTRAGEHALATSKMMQLHHDQEQLFSSLEAVHDDPQAITEHPAYQEAKNSFIEIRQQVLLLAIFSASLCLAIISLIVYRILTRENALSQALRALNEANESLETRVAERTATLLEARDKAMEASRIKSQFLANISHELRTPLNAVIGYSSILYEHFTEEAMLESEEIVQLLENINSSGNNLLELIEDILDISRLETGQINISPSKFDAHELLEHCLKAISPLFEKRENQLLLDYQSEVTQMRTDPVRLRQVLMHLLNNANKFTHKGNVVVRVRVTMIHERQWLVLRVQDTGIGIRHEDQTKLFQVFSQVDGSSTRQYGGVGLGLVICQRFCQLMGGCISVQSELGKGSTFTVRLPMNVTDEQLLPSPANNPTLGLRN